MIEHLAEIEQDSSGTSLIHSLDARVKLLVSIFFIIIVVAYPNSTGVYLLGLCLGCILFCIWVVTRLSFIIYLKRFIMTLPFGAFILVAQIFFKSPHYTTVTPIYLFFLTMYAESIEYASILGVKFILCISSVVILSSTTPVQELLLAARRLGLPPVIALTLGLMIRYLFVFARMFGAIQDALYTRHFDPFTRNLSYKYRLKILGYAMGVVVLRSYEQGERTYLAMLSRGYGYENCETMASCPLKRRDISCLIGISMIILVASVITAMYSVY